ncbi:hypothetical protein C8J55DRAFT_436892 [Lentinula edodes]|uniref:HECT domain-containing protein n=1 Tax=Lentinula lateritia TaxID=40482 RepID=A0A9W8ZXU3_9AGAR|nr:hypothetical protein C8J55DRAFT_436892 [Lentinula edodes]
MGGLRRRQFVAEALFDSRIIDLSFHKVRLKLVLGEEVSLTSAMLKVSNVVHLQLNLCLSLPSIAWPIPFRSYYHSVTVEDPVLDFMLPGYDIELKVHYHLFISPMLFQITPPISRILVMITGVPSYVQFVLKAILGSESTLQAKPFREGISKVFPIGDQQASTVEELMMLFGNGDEDYTVETISEALESDHEFNPESRAIHDLLEIMTEYDTSMRLLITRQNNQISGRSFCRVFRQLVQCVHYEFGNCNVNNDEHGPHK